MAKQIVKPGTESWHLSISDADFAKLKRSILAQSSDDHWAFLAMTDEELANQPQASRGTPHMLLQMTDEEWEAEMQMMEEETDEETTDEPPVDLFRGGNISIRRSWTNTELYRIVTRPSEGGTSAKIETLIWEEDRIGGMTKEQAKIDVVLLCSGRSSAECDLDAAPNYHPFLFSEIPASMRTPEILATAVPSTDVQSGTN